MNLPPRLLPAAAAFALAASLPAQVVGTYPPAWSLTDFHGAGIPSVEDLKGRVLLLEFFAYW